MLTRVPIFLVIALVVTAKGDSSEKATQTETVPKQQRSSNVNRWNSYLDRQLADPLTFHYLWPWSQLFKAVAALDEDVFNEPKIVSSKEKYEVHMNVRRFKPDELKIIVKNRYIIVEGKHKETGENKPYLANHFVQNLVLPAGSKAEEVRAVLKDGVLTVTVPRHELPPPPPEREVPIEVIATEKSTEAAESSTEKTDQVEASSTTEKKAEADTSSAAPLSEQLELVEATTHAGKIRKKELKEPKPSKLEVAKGLDENGLDYALIDTE